jgi:AraC-like DNA-binding protein
MLETEVRHMQNDPAVEAVQKMQDYILQHIGEHITLYALSCVSGYSPWHASKLFKQLTGTAPIEYIRSLRLSRAALSLTGGAKVIDVALDFAFGSHEGFTRAFTDRFGISPRDYRKTPRPVPLFMPQRMSDFCLRLQKGEIEMSEFKKNNTVFVQVADRPARKLILKRGVKAEGYFEYCGEVGCDIWEELCAIPDALQEPMGLWLPDRLRTPGTSKYVQGVEMPAGYTGTVPDGYEMITLNPCKMMIFQGPPFADADFEEAIGSLWQIMAEYNPEFYGFAWADDDAPRFQLSPVGERGYIEGRPVRPL